MGKLPFSDDINAQSRLLMRRNVRERVAALAPFLTYDQDPYIVVGEDGRLSWMMDAFTTSDSYPYSSHSALGRPSVNYMRNSVKVTIDPYNGTTTFYVFDTEDPVLAAYRRIFPSLFKDAAAMPADLRKHVRYPELLFQLQAEVYGLYHMTDPEVFFNREDLGRWPRRPAGQRWGADETGDAAEFCVDEAAGRGGHGVCGDSSVHAGKPEQSDWMDCRAQRRRELRNVRGLRLSQDEAGGWAAADESRIDQNAQLSGS